MQNLDPCNLFLPALILSSRAKQNKAFSPLNISTSKI